MSDQSSRLRLSYLAPAQAQKHVTVNETFLRLDGLVQLSARSAQIGAQPGAPTDGDIYLLPPGKTGADWGAMANGALAYYRDGVWEELTPKAGWRCFVEDEEALYARGANAWLKIAASDERRLIFTPGGDGDVSIYRIDTQRAQNPRTANIASVAGDAITLTTPNAGLFFNDAFMANVSYVRIWNITKSPNQSAWVRRQPSSTKLLVLDASAISDWSTGDVVQIGDPTNQMPNRVIAIDISPMMQNVLGRVFPQAGLQLKASVEGVGAAGILDTSSDGQTGSFSGVRSEQSGSRLSGQYTQLTGISSSISSSNLLFVRETASGGTIALTALSVIGLWL